MMGKTTKAQRQKEFLLSFLLIFCICGYSRAQDLSTTDVSDQDSSVAYVTSAGISSDDLVNRMLNNNPELQAARQRLEGARGRLLQAGLRPNPNIEYLDLSDRLTNNDGQRENELTIVQPLEIGGKRRYRVDVAQKEVDRISYEIADLERQRTSELESLIGQAFTQAAQLRAIDRILRLNNEIKNATEVRIKAGDASEYEFAQVESESGRLEIEKDRISVRLDELMVQIKTLTGMPITEQISLRESQIQPDEINISFGEALKLATENRPDLKAAKLAEEEAKAKIKLADTGKIPDIGAIVGFKRDATVSPAPQQSSNYKLKVGVSVTIPLFNRNQGLVSENAALLAEARLHRQSVEQFIYRDVAVAMKHLEQARREMDMYKDRLLPVAQKSLRMAKLGFDLGELHLSEYLSEQRKLTDIESSYAQARANLFLATAEVEKAIGKAR